MPITQIDFSKYTQLPLKEIVKGDTVGRALIVTMPYGEEIINYQQNYSTMFSGPKTIEVQPDYIIAKLRKLESKARDYLFHQWLTK